MVKTCFCKTTSWKGKWVIGLKVGKSYLITQSVDYEMDELISLIRTKQEYLKKYKELSYPIVIIGGYKEKIDRYDFKEIELLFELDKAKSKYQLNSNEEIIKLIYVKKGFYSLDFQNYFKNDSPTNKEFDLKQVFLLINNFKYLKLEFNHELMNPELIPFPNVEKQQFSSLVSIIKYNYKSFKYIAKNRKLLYQKHQLVTEAIYYHQLKYMDLVITLILNSIVVYFVIYFISLNKYRIGRKICSLIQRFTVENIKELIGWLQGEPAGLKLNSGLTKFLGQLFLCVIYPFIELSDIWPSYINFLLNFAIIISILFGLSGLLAFSMDLFSLICLHLNWFYLLASKLFHWHLNINLSLFNLFIGKRYNPLRDRFDQCQYNMDQLTLGTLLFTVSAFLFPTIFVYYLASLLAKLSMLVVLCIIQLISVIWLKFPFFSIYLKLFCPSLLPGGVKLSPIEFQRQFRYINTTNIHYFHFQPVSIPLLKILSFVPHLTCYFNSYLINNRILNSLLCGKAIPPFEPLFFY